MILVLKAKAYYVRYPKIHSEVMKNAFEKADDQ